MAGSIKPSPELSQDDRYNAIVVGCGPVGVVAALHLANAGMRVAVVEEQTNIYPYPRAVMLDAYSCAILAEIMGEDFDRVQLNPTPGAGYFLDKEELDKPFAWTGLDIGDRRTWFVQPQLEGVLRDVMAAQDGIDTFLGWSARKLYADGDARLTITHTVSAETRELRAEYLLGCDGGGSFVRKQAGGRLKTLGDTVLFLIVDAKVPTEHLVGEPGVAYQVVDQERPTTYLPMTVNDHCRWEFRINPDDDILALQSPERILELLSPWADTNHVELIRHTVYKFNSLIATRWRFGNVFLCGDAAHQTSPFLGQGLNMGIRNTRNLVQKMELVASGASSPDLLDQYQVECFDDTKGTIKEALKMGKLLFNTSGTANALRAAVQKLRRGNPINITSLVSPTTRVLNLPGRVPSKLRRVLPRVRVTPAGGTPTMLPLIEPARPKIVVDGPLVDRTATWLQELLTLPEVIRPEVFTIVDHLDVQTAARPLLIVDATQRADLFGDDQYLVLLENSVVLGRYERGDEQQLADDYERAFQLSKSRAESAAT